MPQHITVVGNLVAEPERRRSGASPADTIANFRIACSDRRKDERTGTWSDGPPSYYSVSVFGALAENVLSSLHRGQRAIVTGTLQMREWESGSKSGVSADVKASAVGPDLRWGSAVFAPGERAARAGGTPADAPEDHDDGASDAEGSSVPDSGLGVPTGWAAEPLAEATPF